MEKTINVTLTEDDKRKLETVLYDTDPGCRLHFFISECLEKYHIKMAMKQKIYSPAEMPTILKASFRVELDDSLMEKLLSPDMEQVLGPDLYEMFLYRAGKGKE